MVRLDEHVNQIVVLFESDGTYHSGAETQQVTTLTIATAPLSPPPRCLFNMFD